MDLSTEKQEEIMNKYGHLVCDSCKEKLRKNMIPIKERLDKGKPPHMRHMIRLQKSICLPCQMKIAKAKLN